MNEEKDQLLKDIAAEEKIISQLPPYSQHSNSTTYAQKRAGHQKTRADMLERLVLIEEEQRVASVVQEHLELHPYMQEKECPICLETIPITERDSLHFMSCCGGGYCMSCSKDMLEHGKLETCALCRAEYPSNDKVRADGIKKWAKKGNPIAQNLLAGLLHSGGNSAIPVNKRQALKWARASKDHPGSLFIIAAMHQAGECGLERSEEKMRSLLKVCAEGGYKDGQEEYAAMCWWGKGGGVDRETSLRYASLACRDGDTDIRENLPQAACLLGWLYQFGEGGVDKSVTLAKHYLQLSADGEHPMAYFQLAEVLITESLATYDNLINIPGFSQLPKALYWARKSVAENDKKGIHSRTGITESKAFVKRLEAKVPNRCAECNKGKSMQQFSEITILNNGPKLMCCVRCRAAWYCSKECQLKHWNAGHKVDCIKTKKKTRG